ncbi:MAG: hypothetical protein Ta2F_03340 [Termitinemataceae bacterium]|nr:MAG: hypothetical protein Ta2F_03340 [Termitinemataceae bacterium]
MIFLLITIAVIAFVAISIKTSGSKTVGGSGKTSVSWLQFQSKGRDSGFNIKEIKLLQDLAKRSSAQNPAALFWSQNTMDTCIKDLVTDLRAKKILNLPENQDFLSRLFEFRKKMELEKPRYKNGITGSREISTLQTVQVVVQDYGIFYSKVLAVNSLFYKFAAPRLFYTKIKF